MWLTTRKLQFFLRPFGKRVRLEIVKDGRHLTYLLASLNRLGYALYIVKSPMLFRELLRLKKAMVIPFVFGGRERRCDLVISDREEAITKARSEGIQSVFLDYDFFNEAREECRMPYFMHPSAYQAFDHSNLTPSPELERPITIGFFGTRDAVFYSRNFNFPMLNREQILEYFFKTFADLIVPVGTSGSEFGKSKIVVSVDQRGGDHGEKSFLPLAQYFAILSSTNFFLSTPGWCIPLAHNLIEGMSMGSIPIINSSEYLHPNLEHGVNCLAFTTLEELEIVVNLALSMPAERIKLMRRNVFQYYDKYLQPGSWLANAIEKRCDCVLVNAEELSLTPTYSYED